MFSPEELLCSDKFQGQDHRSICGTDALMKSFRQGFKLAGVYAQCWDPYCDCDQCKINKRQDRERWGHSEVRAGVAVPGSRPQPVAAAVGGGQRPATQSVQFWPSNVNNVTATTLPSRDPACGSGQSVFRTSGRSGAVKAAIKTVKPVKSTDSVVKSVPRSVASVEIQAIHTVDCQVQFQDLDIVKVQRPVGDASVVASVKARANQQDGAQRSVSIQTKSLNWARRVRRLGNKEKRRAADGASAGAAF